MKCPRCGAHVPAGGKSYSTYVCGRRSKASAHFGQGCGLISPVKLGHRGVRRGHKNGRREKEAPYDRQRNAGAVSNRGGFCAEDDRGF